jgi:hypothetical protein
MLSARVEVVLSALESARAGRFAEICDLFAPPLRPLITPKGLEAGWEAELARQGPVTSIGAPLTEPTGSGAVVVKVPIAPWEPPKYADPDSFDEHEVSLGTDALAVDGTLSVPT